ncbi:Zinc finger, CCHC-type, partial [Cynara cardunculus var. scolymus]
YKLHHPFGPLYVQKKKNPNFVVLSLRTLTTKYRIEGISVSSVVVGLNWDLEMSSDSRSRSRSRSPMDRKIRTQRSSYRDAPYRRESRRGYSQSNLCKNCKRPGHYARECPNVAICHNCGLPGKTGHLARDCLNDPVCNLCNVAGHVARDCPKGNMIDDRGGPRGGDRGMGGFRDIVCRNCQQVGHMSRDCVALMICHNCGGRGHLAFECPSGRFMDRFPRSTG